MPCAPRSPSPRMREPSVTTITCTSSWFQLKHLRAGGRAALKACWGGVLGRRAGAVLRLLRSGAPGHGAQAVLRGAALRGACCGMARCGVACCGVACCGVARCPHGGEEAAVLAGEVHAAAAAVLVAELLAHVPHRGRVDQRRQLLHVVDEDAVVEGLVAVVQVL